MSKRVICTALTIFILTVYVFAASTLLKPPGEEGVRAAYSDIRLKRPQRWHEQGYFEYLAEVYIDNGMLQVIARHEDLVLMLSTLGVLVYISISVQPDKAERLRKFIRVLRKPKGFWHD